MGTVVIESYLASRFKKTTFIATVRVDPVLAAYSNAQKKMLSLIHSFSDAVFVQNEMQKQCFSKKTQKKTFVVFNPVSEVFLEHLHKNEGDIIRIATSGRLTEQKNHKMLIDAIETVSKKHSNVVLTVYGERRLLEELERYISEKKLTDNVKLFGRSNDMCAELLKNDMFVLSSNYEGMPNALLEAMAIGLPCIATDCPTGPSEMIVNEENGLLIPVDDAEKMQEAIEFMYNNRDKAEGMGESARKHVSENYRVDRIVNKFIEICR